MKFANQVLLLYHKDNLIIMLISAILNKFNRISLMRKHRI